MGTRNLTVIKHKGDIKLAQYGQWDGYPSGLGIDLLRTLKNIDLSRFKRRLNHLRFLTDKEINVLNMSTDWQNTHPHLVREVSGARYINDFLMQENFLKHNKVVNQIAFGGDGLFCEWAYVIDLDSMTFQVYKGFYKRNMRKNGFFNEYRDKESEYYPVQLTRTFDIENLPSDDTFMMNMKPWE